MSTGPVSLEIKLDRYNKTFTQGEEVRGTAVVRCKTKIRHEGITLELGGGVQMQVSGRAQGLLEAAFSSGARPLGICGESVELAGPGRLGQDTHSFPFALPLRPKGSHPLHETYHGVFVAVQYSLRLSLKRSFPAKGVEKTTEVLVEQAEGQGERATTKPLAFSLSPDSVRLKEKGGKVPPFAVTGRLDSSSCLLGRPITGEVKVRECGAVLKSLDVQLVRVENVGGSEGGKTDATEVQTLQIGDGSVEREVGIPIHMVLPRLFTAPTLETPNFGLRFQLNLLITFANDFSVKETFPITLHRH